MQAPDPFARVGGPPALHLSLMSGGWAICGLGVIAVYTGWLDIGWTVTPPSKDGMVAGEQCERPSLHVRAPPGP